MGVWRRGRRLKLKLLFSCFSFWQFKFVCFIFVWGFFCGGGVVFLLFPSNSHSLCEAIHPLKLSYLSTRCEGFWLSLSPRETHYSQQIFLISPVNKYSPQYLVSVHRMYLAWDLIYIVSEDNGEDLKHQQGSCNCSKS